MRCDMRAGRRLIAGELNQRTTRFGASAPRRMPRDVMVVTRNNVRSFVRILGATSTRNRLHTRPEKVFALVFFLVLFIPGLCLAGWKTKTLSRGGAYNSIAIDPSGNPHISYLDDSNSADYVLRHASFNGKSWHKEIVDSGDVGWWNSIALDPLGHIHISYLADKPAAALRYAHFDGTNWRVTTVDQTGGYSTSIAVGNDNLPHISYVDFSGNLKYARFDGIAWNIETLGAFALWFGQTSLALGPSGEAIISFSDSSLPRRLYWATNASGFWVIKQVGDGIQASLALDSLGQPHIVFNSEATHEIFYSRHDGTNWISQNLTELAEAALGAKGIGERPDIALDSQNRPHVTSGVFVPIGESGVEILIYARFNGMGWEFEMIDSKNSGFENSIALDPWNLPHVSYRKPAKGEKSKLKYANSGIKPPQIVTKSLKEGKSGKQYKAKLKAKDGKKPYQWEVNNGTLPPGLELDPMGVIAGAPSEVGEFGFEIKVSDALGLSRTATFTLMVQ